MRNALVIGGLVVVALVVALYFAMKKDSAAAQGSQGTSTTSGQGSAVVTAPPRAGQPNVTPGLTGDRPAPTMPQAAPGQYPKDYVVGDIHVRDHREGDNKPLDIPPNVHPAEGPAIQSTLTADIAQKVKAVVYECTASIPKNARGDKPRAEGQILIAIKNHNVTVTKSIMQLRNVTGESVEPAKQCIEQKSVGLTSAAPEQADIDSYSINLSYAIP
jgi:hypothetical protein